MYFKNIVIESVGHGGVGVARLPNKKVLLIRGGCVPGTTVSCMVIKKKRDHREAKLLDITEYNDKKIDPLALPEGFRHSPCHHCVNPFRQYAHADQATVGCGGCLWQHLTYDHQLTIKNTMYMETIKKISDYTTHANIHDVIPASREFGYRNKIEFSFGKYISRHEEGVIEQHRQMGFHKQGQFAKVIDVETCHLINDPMQKVFAAIKHHCQASGLPVYDQKTHLGLFRHCVIRHGYNTGQTMLHLVYSGTYIEGNSEAAALWASFRQSLTSFAKDHNITTFCLTNNTDQADVVKGQNAQTEILYGEGSIIDTLIFPSDEKNQEKRKLTMRISPFSFFQTNTYGAQELFALAASLVPTGCKTMIDLYCGGGSVGLSFLKMGKVDEVIGIEIVEDAIRDAKHNATINGLQNQTYFVAGKAEDCVQHDAYLKQKKDTTDLIVVDPPRDGLHKTVIQFLNDCYRVSKPKLIYISCNPVTFARDCEGLCQGGWVLKELRAIDLFPQTHHLELVALFG